MIVHNSWIICLYVCNGAHITAEKTAALSMRYENRPVTYFEMVSYMGGHPEVRQQHRKGALVITDAGIAYLENADSDAREIFNIPFSRITEVKCLSDQVTVTAWSESLPVAVSQTKDRKSMLAIAFRNDVEETSVIALSIPLLKAAEDKLTYALYDWKKSQKAAGI